ncbi:MAG: fasciclin domain-containing protein [Chitinophagaceae bacterium]|nr:fasciclin domain-containing protein [Chitinophagaceae bacterium]
MLYKHTRSSILSYIFFAGCLLIGACRKEVRVEKKLPDGYFGRTKFILQANAGFSKFCKYLQDASLYDSLAGDGPFTVLAPEDNAFTRMPYPLDPGTLVQRLKYHVLNGSYSLKKLPLGMNQELPAADERKVWVSKWKEGEDTLITVNGCKVKQADMTTTNGYINILENMMELEDYPDIENMMKNDQSLTFLSTALNRTGLFKYIKENPGTTILAPDNNTFRGYSNINSMERVLSMDLDSLTRLIKHHLIPGKQFMPDLVRVTGRGNYHDFTMLDGTNAKAYSDGRSIYWVTDNGWIYPVSGQRVSYPAENAILHRIGGVLFPWPLSQ